MFATKTSFATQGEMPVKTKQGRTLSRTDALQNRFVAQLELAAADNELELVVDAIGGLLLHMGLAHSSSPGMHVPTVDFTGADITRARRGGIKGIVDDESSTRLIGYCQRRGLGLLF